MSTHYTIWLGIILILLGVALIIIPIIGKYIQVEKIPNWLIYIYHSDGFYFGTSPILLAISAIAIILFFLRH